jgi:citrate lyase subunit beta/citryl-CoA lyase
MQNFLPRRSVLFVPGSNQRALNKSLRLNSDVVIMDLEDSVSSSQLEISRRQIQDTMNIGKPAGREYLVRVNSVDTPWCSSDLNSLIDLNIDGLVIPKVSSCESLERIETAVSDAGLSDDLPLWIMLETPAGILALPDMLKHNKRVSVIMIGTADLSTSMRIPETPGRLGLLVYLSQCVLAARAFDVDIIDGIYQNFSDAKGLQRACEQGRNLGFDGKTLIHPNQIEYANKLFAANFEELESARAIVDAWERATQIESKIIVLDGKMIEQLHVDAARDLLYRNSVIQSREKLRN